MSVLDAVASAAKGYAARRTPGRRRTPMADRVEPNFLRVAAVRLTIASVWAVVVGTLTYGGARALDLPDDDLVPVSIMSTIGAAIFVLFFAGGP